MTSPCYKSARKFIYSNARLLERHLFSFHFEKGSPTNVLNALKAYQHENGLFGYGLEPDKRASAAQPVDQAFAMEVLDAVQADGSQFLNICHALEKLSNEDGGLPFSHPSVATDPHAEWWACDDIQPSSINPTGIILSWLWKNRVTHPWMGDAEKFCWLALKDVPPTSCHSIFNALAFLSKNPNKERAAAELPRLKQLLRNATCFDPQAQGYVFTPLSFAPSPESAGAACYSEKELQPHLKFLADQQETDGGWPINWPALSDGVLSECRGVVTLRNLQILRAYGALEQ